MPDHVYCCAECGQTKINMIRPATNNCPGSPFHRWINVGVKGNIEYVCRHCMVIVRTAKLPVTYGCRKDTFHEWKDKQMLTVG